MTIALDLRKKVTRMDKLYVPLDEAVEIARRFMCDRYVVIDDDDVHDLRDEMLECSISARLMNTQIPE